MRRRGRTAEIHELTQEQLHHAHKVTVGLLGKFSFRRVEWMFQCLRAGLPLLHPTSMLTREERIWMAATIVALRHFIGHEATERAISFLGSRDGIMQLLTWDTFRQEHARAREEGQHRPPAMTIVMRPSTTVH